VPQLNDFAKTNPTPAFQTLTWRICGPGADWWKKEKKIEVFHLKLKIRACMIRWARARSSKIKSALKLQLTHILELAGQFPRQQINYLLKTNSKYGHH